MTAILPDITDIMAATTATHTVPIAMYHSIAHTTNARYARFALAPELLREQLDALVDGGWTTLTASEYAAARCTGRPIPARSVVLTFDDGFTDFATVALPMLRDRGLTATLYVPTGLVGDTSRWMTHERETERPLLDWRELAEIADSGVEIGAHSHTHPQLDRLPLWRLAAELRRPREVLENQLQLSVQTFAYPYGYRTAAVRRAVAEAGYVAACAVDDLPTKATDDSYELPRLTIAGGTTAETFLHQLQSPRTTIRTVRSRVKATVWRSARRCGMEELILAGLDR
jgi:peptidoglycan/xylan/chitin deacetylase (PgdA/CDA1 family)